MKKRGNGEGSICFSRGYWIAQITLPNGKRKKKYTKTQKDAKEWLLTQRSAIREAVWTETDTITISAYIDRYMADVGSNILRPKSVESYSSLIKIHIKPAIGHIKLTALTPAHLQHFYTTKLNAGLSRRTVHFIHAILHKSFKQAVRWGLMSRNVCDLAEPPTAKRKIPTTWSLEEVKRFTVSAKGSRFYGIYILGLATGMRIGELLGLQVQDVSLEKGTIQVRHAIQTLIGKGLVLTEPKTELSRRLITVPKFALEVLALQIKGKQPNDFVFATRNATPFAPRNVVRDFKSTLREISLPNIRFHDLRHTCATLHLLAGTHPKAVQEILGHSSITLTLATYSHVLPTVHDEAAERMNEMLK